MKVGICMKVLNIGSLNIDYVYKVSHIVRGGETILSDSMQTFCGGKGLNQSIALAKAGVNVYHAGMIGEEGEMLLDACKKYGVKTDLIKKIKGKSGHTIIQVDKNAQNCIILYGGANQMLTRDMIGESISQFEKGDILLLQNEVNDLSYIIDTAAEKGLFIVLNPSPFNDKLKECDLTKISMFLLNEIEGEQISGESEPEKILNVLKEMFPKARIILTLGERGSIYQDFEQRMEQGIFPAIAVDTTAAGDTFTGYFIASMIEGKTPEECLKTASYASSIAVARMGAVESIPMRDEVMKNN